MTLTAMPKYEAYKDSGVEWIGDIPTEWDVLPIKRVLKLISEKVSSSKSDLQYIGLENIESWSGKIIDVAQDVEGLANEFFPQDILFGKLRPYLAKVALAVTHGICSTELLVYRSIIGQPAYFKYLLSSQQFIELVNSSTYGSKMPRANADFIGVQRIPIPSEVERTSISDFLDEKTGKIDEAIAIKEKQIDLLNERKKILIQQAVTQGLDPTVPMTDSGVTWIGKIPAHWEVRRSKFVFCQRKERARADDVQLSATQAYGVIPQEQYEEIIGRRVVKISFHLEKRKHVEIDDFVISMRSFQGGLERAWASGCIRSSYVVLRPVNKDEVDAGFFSYMLKLPTYINALQMTASFIRDGQDLNFDNFAQVDLFIPPIEEQKAIFYAIQSKVDEINKSIALFTDQITKYQEYKTTLINSAVTGKIKVV